MDFYISPGTRATYTPSSDFLNIAMDFNAAPEGRTARGTEVIIPDNASPEVRAAAERFNAHVAAFARRHGIEDYPVRGVKTRSENKRGVPNTVHVEPFFNTDTDFQEAIRNNPEEFAAIYRDAFSALPNARLIAPHGVGRDRGAVSEIFGDETTYGELIANTLLNTPGYELMVGDEELRPFLSTSGTLEQASSLAPETSPRPPARPEGLAGPEQRSKLDLLMDDLPEALAYLELPGSAADQGPRISHPPSPLSVSRSRTASPGSSALGRLGIASLA